MASTFFLIHYFCNQLMQFDLFADAGAGFVLGEDIADVLFGDAEGNVGIGLLIRRLHRPLAGTLALDDADDLIIIAADAQ